MEIRPISAGYAVSPQISPEDVAGIRAAGYRTIICNRPDGEVPPELQAEAVRRAAEAEGVTFVDNPIDQSGMTEDAVSAQRRTEDGAEGPVLAYCNSGTRSTVVWMFAHAPDSDPDALLAAARQAGYALDMLRPQLQALRST